MRQQDQHQSRAIALADTAEQHRRRSEFEQAAVALQEGCMLVREVLATGEADQPAVLAQLGALLYLQAADLLALGRLGEAIVALDEAEQAYGQLAASEDVSQLMADVVMRRARAFARSGSKLSAVVDAQRALNRTRARADGAAVGSPERLDLARVAAYTSEVQLMVGVDPDLAVGAAEHALREYVGAFQGVDGVPAIHGPPIQVAALTAVVVHTAHDRRDRAAIAARFITETVGATLPAALDQSVDLCRQTPTLRAVLAGHDTLLAERLTAPAVDGSLLVPSMRTAIEAAPVVAERLLDVAAGAEPPHASLLRVEAHALYAAASAAGSPDLKLDYGAIGRPWGDAVLALGQELIDTGLLAGALDAARWLGGITQQMEPSAADDAGIEQTVTRYRQWQRELLQVVDTAG
jgi:hypothetical protein